MLKPEQILYVESRRNKIIHCIKGSLHTWEQQLEPYGFMPSHRSYLVNINQIEQIGYFGRTFEILLKSGDKVPLSRSYVKELRKMLSDRQK
ncbi:MAG: hypothetical protein CVU90_10240 [Firmicutes bacterium HGW-Firmicutes-15]|nr:MAG: hypothetical protein CVU90_10240 [Firmicutes bacterium HGW-Firmicutes-15]